MIRKIKLNSGMINTVEMLTGRKYTRQTNHADLSSDYVDATEVSDMIRDLIVVAQGHRMREEAAKRE